LSATPAAPATLRPVLDALQPILDPAPPVPDAFPPLPDEPKGEFSIASDLSIVSAPKPGIRARILTPNGEIELS